MLTVVGEGGLPIAAAVASILVAVVVFMPAVEEASISAEAVAEEDLTVVAVVVALIRVGNDNPIC